MNITPTHYPAPKYPTMAALVAAAAVSLSSCDREEPQMLPEEPQVQILSGRIWLPTQESLKETSQAECKYPARPEDGDTKQTP